MIKINTEEIKKVINVIKTINNTKGLGIPEFKDLTMFLKDNFLYLTTLGDLKGIHTIKFFYKIQLDTIEEESKIITVDIQTMLSSLKYMSTQINLDFEENFINIINEEDSTIHIKLPIYKTPKNIVDYIELEKPTFMNFNFNSNNPIMSEELKTAILNQVKLKNIDKLKSNNYLCFLPNGVSVQQFNYATYKQVPTQFDGIIPINIFNFIFSINNNQINIRKSEDTFIFNNNEFYLSVSKISTNYHNMDTLVVKNTHMFKVDKEKLIKSIEFVMNFSKNNTGYIEFKENLIIKNYSTESTNESLETKVSKELNYEKNFDDNRTYGLDLSIFYGLVNLIDSDEVTFSLDMSEDFIGLFIYDASNKNYMSLDVYSI